MSHLACAGLPVLSIDLNAVPGRESVAGQRVRIIRTDFSAF